MEIRGWDEMSGWSSDSIVNHQISFMIHSSADFRPPNSPWYPIIST